MITLNQINKEIQKKHPHVYVVKGEGYFYLWSDDDKTALFLAGLYENAIYAYRVNHLTLTQWAARVDDIILHDRNVTK